MGSATSRLLVLYPALVAAAYAVMVLPGAPSYFPTAPRNTLLPGAVLFALVVWRRSWVALALLAFWTSAWVVLYATAVTDPQSAVFSVLMAVAAAILFSSPVRRYASGRPRSGLSTRASSV